MGVALERAMQCEQINLQRQQLCEQIEQAAIALCEEDSTSIRDSRVLVIVQPDWHHGVIGIVASRLVERYGVPVFIGTNEDDAQIRGSARSIPEFNVFDALQFCRDVLTKFGGHRAAGGFSLPVEKLEGLRSQLRTFAHQCLQPEHLKPLVVIDAQADLSQIDHNLYAQIDALHPCGIANPDPVFWSANVRVCEQKQIGKGHLKVVLSQDEGLPTARRMTAIAWRWGDYYPLPKWLDVAYRVRSNEWNGEVSIELELVGARLPSPSDDGALNGTLFQHGDRPYTCEIAHTPSGKLLKIQNTQGRVLVIQQGQKMGTLGGDRQPNTPVDVTQPFYFDLIKAALGALEKSKKQS